MTQIKKTEIESEINNKMITSNEYLNPVYTIPMAFHSVLNKLSKQIEKHNCVLEYKTKTDKSDGEKTTLPSHYNADGWVVDAYLVKGGLQEKRRVIHPCFLVCLLTF